VIVLVARLLLAVVLAIAAVAKLGRRAETESTLEAFGIPAGLRGSIAAALPPVELAIAAALLPAASAAYAGIAAVLLFAAFSLAVASALRRGEQVECNCFGSLAPTRIGPWTLVRNLGLLAVAVLVTAGGFADPGPSAVAWVGELGGLAAVAILAGLALGAAALNFAFSWQLMKQNGRLVAELEALRLPAPEARPAAVGLGELAPSFALPDLDGRAVELDELLDDGRGLLLFFSDPGCTACDPLLPELGRRHGDAAADPRPLVISLGEPAATREKLAGHGIEAALLQADFDLPRSLGITGMPGAVVLDAEGRIASEPALGTEKVTALLAATAPALTLTTVGAGA
jgi:peroxiredoxin